MSKTIGVNSNKNFKNDILIIESGRIEKNYWQDLWRFRELFFVLAKRDISVRYKQTSIGILWAILRPFLTMIIFTIIFNKVAKLPTEINAPYSLVVFAGMLPWMLFSTSLSEASNSLIGNTNLITKVYFPRLIIPISSVITSFIDFLISFALIIVLMFYYSYVPSYRITILPFFMFLAFLSSIGPGLWLTGLNVKYRDFRYIIPFIVQIGLYISPVGFSSSVIPDNWKLLYSLNPIVGVIDGFRWCIFHDYTMYWPGFCVSLSVTIFFTFFGIYSFRKIERSFADLI